MHDRKHMLCLFLKIARSIKSFHHSVGGCVMCMYGSLITTQSRAYIIPTTMGAVVLYCDRDKIWIANAALACHCAHSTTCMGGGGGWISRPFFATFLLSLLSLFLFFSFFVS